MTLLVRVGDGEDDALGSFVLRSTSFNTIRTLAARLQYFSAVSGGRLACLPLELKLRGKGVPHLRRSGSRGDLHVLVNVVVPTKLSKRQKELLSAYADESNEITHATGSFLDKVRDALS